MDKFQLFKAIGNGHYTYKIIAHTTTQDHDDLLRRLKREDSKVHAYSVFDFENSKFISFRSYYDWKDDSSEEEEEERCEECQEPMDHCCCTDDERECYEPTIKIINKIIAHLGDKPKTPANIYDSSLEVLKKARMMPYTKLLVNITDFILFLYPVNGPFATP
jgi:hypothetical protein